MSTTKLLIAGGTGTNGRELLRQLGVNGIPARALVRDVASAADLADDGVELVQGDLNDPASLAAAFKGIEQAYIVTAVHKDSVQLVQNFFSAAQAAGVMHLVKYSALGASPDAAAEILRQHGQSDRALMDSGLTYTILQPNSFYQNLLWQAVPICDSGQFYLPAGEAQQSLVDVRDIAEATVNILTNGGHENRTYKLTGPAALSFHDVADILTRVLGKPVTYVPVSVADAEAAMRAAGMPRWEAHAVAEIQGVFASGQFASISDHLAQLLGRRPCTFEEFAQDHVAAFIT